MTLVTKPSAPPQETPWAPRMWQGCDFLAWLKLLARNRFKIHWSFLYIAIIVTFVSFWHTLLKWIQEAIYGRRIRRTKIKEPPIFILGHWRTGTTLLHEFMILDPRHGYPTTYECLEPNHFLLTEKLVSRFLWFLIPGRRLMDNMKAGFDRPQEDEFAMCMLGQPSPYLTIAFPNHPPQYQEFLDLRGVRPGALRSWKRALTQFLKQITYKTGKRLVLKSPPHTARIKVLKEMFPNALFLHIVRDPYAVYPSTVNLWKTLYRAQGLQKPTFAGLEDLVLNNFTRLYERLEEGKKLLAPEQFYELRYEDLVRDPVGEMRKVYEHFRLGGIDEYLPRLQAYLATIKGYETNKYALSEVERATIAQRWRKVIERYGYQSAD
ncbi:MAG: sulfotransferase [Planctomycetes bacterium]|nr:sulfotransferase [Planctomycetota bacterium]